MQNDLFAPSDNQLTELSFGAGQESSTLFEMYLNDQSFRDKYAPNDFLMVMSDTGDEFSQTLEHVKHVQRQCKEANIEFSFITSDLGFHSKSWSDLTTFYKEKEAIGSRTFKNPCSQNLKFNPIYKFLEHWLHLKYGVQHGKKKGIREFALTYGKIKMLLGISKGEEKRIYPAHKSPYKWYRESIEPVYPLIELGMDRAACQSYLEKKGLHVIPSNCKRCPYLSIEELEYLRRFHTDALEEWVGMEQVKLLKYKERETMPVLDKEGKQLLNKKGEPKTQNKNYGVFGVKPLTQKIIEAKALFEHWTDERIIEYRYSHGHCVNTQY